MEKLATGLVLICLLYMILMFGLAYCLDQWYTLTENYRDKLDGWFRLRRRSFSILRELIQYLRNDSSRKAA